MASLFVFGCDSSEERVAPPGDIGSVGASIEFPLCPGSEPCGQFTTSVALSLIDCAAELQCKPAMLRDPSLGGETGPTLIASFSCGFPEGTPAQDALMAMNPEVRCYTGGDFEDPSTWQPPQGNTPVFQPGERLAFSRLADAAGRVFTSWAYLMRPMKDASSDGATWGFCVFEAWGGLVFSGLDEGEPADATCLEPDCARRRDPFHIVRAPIVHWRGLATWTGTAWDCHDEGVSPTSRVERRIVEAAVHRVASPLEKGAFPASQTYGVFSVEPRVAQGLAYDSLVLRFAADNPFPASPMFPPTPMTRRELRVDSVSGAPASVKVSRTCSQNNSERVLQRVGVLLADASTSQVIGAVVVHVDAPPIAPWDCSRTPQGGCELLDEAAWSTLTPCLSAP